MSLQFKPQTWHRRVAVVVLLTLALGAYAGSGYLETAGPAPLRFLPPLRPAPKIVHAPIPEPAPPKPVEPVTPVVVPPPAAVTNIQPVVLQPLIVVPPTNATTAAPQSDDPISPQMLIKYFNKNSNGSSTSVYMPLNMSAPRPTEAPSSSASYTNAP